MQIIRPLRPTESEPLGRGPAIYILTSPAGDSAAGSTTGLEQGFSSFKLHKKYMGMPVLLVHMPLLEQQATLEHCCFLESLENC